LDAYRRILAEAPMLLAPDGLLVLEFGWDQAAAEFEALAA
jgi:methylase of polypeptide subunit release factors